MKTIALSCFCSRSCSRPVQDRSTNPRHHEWCSSSRERTLHAFRRFPE